MFSSLGKPEWFKGKMRSLKTWPEYYQAVLEGKKTFEIRAGSFAENEVLILDEWDPRRQESTGRSLVVRVTYVMEIAPNTSALNWPFPHSDEPVQCLGFARL